jgi:hypothetical protein
LLTYHSLEIGRRVLLGSYNMDDTTDMNRTSPEIWILKSLLVARENCADYFSSLRASAYFQLECD